jgi:hypothetical protein
MLKWIEIERYVHHTDLSLFRWDIKLDKNKSTHNDQLWDIFLNGNKWGFSDTLIGAKLMVTTIVEQLFKDIIEINGGKINIF